MGYVTILARSIFPESAALGLKTQLGIGGRKRTGAGEEVSAPRGEQQGMGSPTATNSDTQSQRPNPALSSSRPSLRHRTEYYAALGLLKTLGVLPHRLTRAFCAFLAFLSYWFWPRLRSVGLTNLSLAFPDWPESQRRRVLFSVFRNFGRMLADFAHFPHWNRGNIEKLIIYDGFENYAQAQSQGRGVLFLTGHFGNWELSSFAHGVYGYPCDFVVRALDNPLIDGLINHYRCLGGGKPIEKGDFARGVLRAFSRGDAVGVLIDQNMLPGEGEFVNFFGIPACTTTGPARVAKKTGVPIVLGLVIWDPKLGKYRLRFDPVEWINCQNPEEEILVNTANFTSLLEDYIRRFPDHWLWVHRRWKTRPPGAAPLYPREGTRRQ